MKSRKYLQKFELELTEEETELLFLKAAEAAVMPEKLLEDFIVSLIRPGQKKAHYEAERWLEAEYEDNLRYRNAYTYLEYLGKYHELGDVIAEQEELESVLEDLEEEEDEETTINNSEIAAGIIRRLQESFRRYEKYHHSVQGGGDNPVDYVDEMQRVIDYAEKCKEVKRGAKRTTSIPLDKDGRKVGTLTISAEGEMELFSANSRCPLCQQEDENHEKEKPKTMIQNKCSRCGNQYTYFKWEK